MAGWYIPPTRRRGSFLGVPFVRVICLQSEGIVSPAPATDSNMQLASLQTFPALALHGHSLFFLKK